MAVRQTYIVKCDCHNCKSVAEVADSNFYPEGWYRVQIANSNEKLDRSNAFDFCGLTCIQRWSRDRKAALTENGNGKKDHEGIGYPCGVCEFSGRTLQGLRAHERIVHKMNVSENAEH